jgi:hypothetical protein
VSIQTFPTLEDLAGFLRRDLARKRLILIYAHNGTGKTRLSTKFKELGKSNGDPDTLYFNAFTEDLFSWDNDLEEDRERKLKINRDSRFITALWELEMDTRIRPFLSRYADFEFTIDTTEWEVRFSRETPNPNYDSNAPLNEDGENLTGERTTIQKDIKISRGEENIFIWCFFLALVQIVVDGDDDNPYDWVKYIYIDDPISSLDEQNAIKVAHDLTDLIVDSSSNLNVIISTHHVLFYNVVANQLRKKASKYYLTKITGTGAYGLENWENVPPFLHLTTLSDLCRARDSGELSNYHFTMLRRVLEQTAAFMGYESWVDCLRPREGESEQAFQKRVLDLNSHGDWVIFDSPRIDDSMRSAFLTIFEEFRRSLPFNPAWVPPA